MPFSQPSHHWHKILQSATHWVPEDWVPEDWVPKSITLQPSEEHKLVWSYFSQQCQRFYKYWLSLITLVVNFKKPPTATNGWKIGRRQRVLKNSLICQKIGKEQKKNLRKNA